MDFQINYPQVIKQVLLDYAQYYLQGGVPVKTLFDDSQQSYLLLSMGWQNDNYIHHVPIHLELVADKIWIQADDTEEGVATELLEAGIPKEKIVLGFKPPAIRPYTEFASH